MTYDELTHFYGEPLMERQTCGIRVAMFCDVKNSEIFIHYQEGDEGLNYSLNPPAFLARDAFYHPNVYFRGEMNGVSNPNRLVPAHA